jgi:ABC-type transport system involved in multi-copper enzyme maturation permease subunit
MMFGFGPVLRAEMITTARRGRYYLARVVYGLLLLYILWEQQASWEWFHKAQQQYSRIVGGTMGGSHEEVRRFAESAFIKFAGTQGLALLCVIPALVAGVIPDENQRKTLHYLLASRLSSAEIVLGKLGARLVHVAAFVALGLPVVGLLGLYGGLNPEYVFYSYVATATSVLFVAGLSMAISIVARGPRDAILLTYGLVTLWLVGPLAIDGVAHAIRGPLFWIGTVNDWFLLSNPVVAWWQLTNHSVRITPFRVSITLGGQFLWHFYVMAAIQTVAGLLFLVLAIAGLRPLRGASWPGAKPRTGWATRVGAAARAIGRWGLMAPVLQNRLLYGRPVRPPCADRPMLWKERYATSGAGLRWFSSPLVLLFFGVALGCYLLDVAQPLFSRIVTGSDNSGPRIAMNGAVRESSVVMGILAMLAVAAAAAVSVTSEREQNTWVSVATTLVTPAELIASKQFGAMWSARRFGLGLAAIWTLGVLLGAVNVVGVLAATAITTVGAWFVSALGVAISYRAANSTRALLLTFLAAFVLGWFWPTLLHESLVSTRDLAALGAEIGPGTTYLRGPTYTAIVDYGIVAAAYAVGAAIFTIWSIWRLGARSRWE